jgi:radical SAM superfamily enzyme with C-terminal helix-hairpin-helix motif
MGPSLELIAGLHTEPDYTYSKRHEFLRLLFNSIQNAIIRKLIIRTHLFFLSTFIGSVYTSFCAKTPIFRNKSPLAGPGS